MASALWREQMALEQLLGAFEGAECRARPQLGRGCGQNQQALPALTRVSTSSCLGSLAFLAFMTSWLWWSKP